MIPKRNFIANLLQHAPLSALVIATCMVSVPATAQECVVKIGTVGPMTGAGASWGLTEKAGVEFEAAWTNEHGGLLVGDHKCKVTVTAVDSQSTAAGGAAASNYLASQGIHVVNGPVLSPENTGFKPVAKRNGQVSFATSFAADVIGPDFPLHFHKTQAPPAWGGPVVKVVKDHFNLKSVIIVGPNDQGGTDTNQALEKLYSAAGIKATSEYYQRGTTNFTPLAVRFMNQSMDAVDVTGMPPGEAAILLKQLMEAGFEGAFGRLGAGGDVIIKNVGGEKSLKAFYSFEHVPNDDPGIVQLRADFERVMKQPVPENELIYNAQIAAEVMLKAISVAGTDQDGEKIAAALRAMTPTSRYLGAHGWRGKTQYGINQEFSFPVAVDFIANGKPEKQVRIEIPAE